MKKQVLTIREANRLARGRAKVSVDSEDARLWRVERPGSVQAHEPMTREAWLAFLDAQAGKEKKGSGGRPETYLADINGRKVRVTIPEGIDEGDICAALKDNLSPQAVATIAVCLQPAKTNNPAVDREVRWFADQLVVLVGGPEAQNRLAEEVGL